MSVRRRRSAMTRIRSSLTGIDGGVRDRPQLLVFDDHDRAGVRQFRYRQPGNPLDGGVEVERGGQGPAGLGQELLVAHGPSLRRVQEGAVQGLGALIADGER